jgi:pyochelin synthetase
VYDMFGTLAAGGTLVTMPQAGLKDPGRWLALIEDEGVTVWNSVPVAMKMLLDYGESRYESTVPTLRLAMLSGDWIPLALPDRIRAFFPGTEVVSLGGATEASIWSIAYPIGTVDPQWKSIPYGQPLTNQAFYILDEALRPVGHDEVGELFIGGQGVALGYWQDAERTARAFVRHPTTGDMLYRTGDLGRYFVDGNIEFLGRKDLQVKIRGYRVELPEIEAALHSCPGVEAGVVVAQGGRQEEKELVAHYVAKGGVTPEELRQHLRTLLPEYMVPQRFLERGSLPLNANGKIDREALHG